MLILYTQFHHILHRSELCPFHNLPYTIHIIYHNTSYHIFYPFVSTQNAGRKPLFSRLGARRFGWWSSSVTGRHRVIGRGGS